eukprot:TRINITY_DN8183_c0_g1_i1.p1 TRINITY_DN8183_c0_g1~~TRINITY_DN8183_c0_g1_i1.p1  ORF type:complete len:460 (-),score=44.16 TRINITY_DN8183_c0_g1_i1:200-1579(-)
MRYCNCHDAAVYVAFLCVGTSCGWFVINAVSNLIANDANVAKNGKMLGMVIFIGSIVNLAAAGLYALWILIFKRFGKKAEQFCSGILMLSCTASFILLIFGWDAGPPDYPIVLLTSVIGNLVGAGSLLILFPMVATYYGGFLIAPVRAGTDLSSMVTAFVAEAQNPSGNENVFSTWLLFLIYTIISSIGLIAWAVVLIRQLGLRHEFLGTSAKETTTDRVAEGESTANSDSSDEESTREDSSSISDGEDGPFPTATSTVRQSKPAAMKNWCKIHLASLSCPKALVLPVVLATATQFNQWCLVTTIGQIGAEMTDPDSCSGTIGKWVYRQSLTLSQVLIPACSLLSSLARCPRWLFPIICLAQYAATISVALATFGVRRSFWITPQGQKVYISSFAAVGGLEGYLITMAYRYIGDSEDISLRLRHSTSTLLSVLTIISINVPALFIGSAVGDGTIMCTPL